jgi:hypothetical protein
MAAPTAACCGSISACNPLVRAMDARNRIRFRNDLPALEQWISARTVLGTPRGAAESETPAPVVEGGTPDAGGEVRPAA